MNKELEFRDCPEIDRQACPLDQVNMPPVRGG
jgi:ribonuclease T2